MERPIHIMSLLTREEQFRFWRSIDKGAETECWPWRARIRLGSNTYGSLRIGGQTRRAHRIAFFLATGEQPPVVMHSCDNPPCCNPYHLKAAQGNAANSADMVKKGRSARGDRNGSRTSPDHYPRGSMKKLSKLTEDAVRFARKVYRSEEVSITTLAKRHFVSRRTMTHALYRRTWRHVA